MADEYMIMLGKEADGFSDNGKAVAVFLARKDELTVTSPDESFLESWQVYVESDPAWVNVHSKSDQPLSSMLGNNAYIFGTWSPYNGDTKADYEKAVGDVNGTTKTFKPKKD